jgi:hypothetical protein
MLFAYPKSAVFGRVLPKSKIYAHANPPTRVKALFIDQVAQIVWQYKLSPETTNLTATRSVPEIQVFSVTVKTGELKQDVLRCIDQAIPFPIIYELQYEDQLKVMAAYKRPNEADSMRWVVGDYFETGWLPNTTTRRTLPVVLNLDKLYAQLLTPLMPALTRTSEGLKDYVARMERIAATRRELEKCQNRLCKEKQFNRKVAINAELRGLKLELDNLIRPTAVSVQ